MELVPASLDRYTAAVLSYGAKKYAPDNWRKGFHWRSIIGSLKRHIADFEEGIDFDEESGLPMLAHIACNVAFLVEHFDKGMGEDDRIKLERQIELMWNDPPKLAH